MFPVALDKVGPEVLAHLLEYLGKVAIMLSVRTFRWYLVTKTK